jgi:hypothetical protein
MLGHKYSIVVNKFLPIRLSHKTRVLRPATDSQVPEILLKSQVPFEFVTPSSMAKEFYIHSRRVNNAKIKQELLVRLSYPTYREGLYTVPTVYNLFDTGDYSC